MLWRGRRALLCALPLTSTALLALLVMLRVDDSRWHVTSTPQPQLPNDKDMSDEALRVVHLDLKGAPPRIAFLRQTITLLAQHGCTALLVEYEDMFPYQGTLANLSAKNAYTREQLTDLLSWARHLGLQVIPLVQTFGHLEFALKLEQFRHIRELDPNPQEVCPTNSATLPFLQDIISQVMSLHPWAQYIHIGCDEVYHLAACARCSASGRNARELFSDHVADVARWVRSHYPGVTPLIWDDMLRHWDPKYLSQSPLGALVEPVVWAYTDNVPGLVPHHVWHWYNRTFPRLWVAGAFKGAGLPTSILPNMRMHYNNQRSWLKMLAHSRSRVAGFVLTGWSRFDHFAVLCEILPSAIPSLLLNLILLTTRESDKNVLFYWKTSLNCPANSVLTIDSTNTNHQPIAACSFPGHSAFLITSKFLTLKSKVENFYKSVTEDNAWMTKYNVRHNFSNPYRVLEGFRHSEGYSLGTDVERFRNEAKNVLLNYFDEYIVEEWIEQRIQPLNDQLSYLDDISNKLVSQRSWPRRPIGI